jgi:hypothetical protein
LSREAAARARAAAEHERRVEEALAELPAVTEAKARNRSKTEPRTSTTDAEARIMKMADGGYRPAYNVQFARDATRDAVVGVAVTNVGSDQAQLIPMLNQLERRTAQVPHEVLVDGGYATRAAITEATVRGVAILAPAPRGRITRDVLPPQPKDSMAVALWRVRMTAGEAPVQYRQRAGLIERLIADVRTRRMGAATIPVRGLDKVHTWALWIALAMNAMCAMEIVPHLMT